MECRMSVQEQYQVYKEFLAESELSDEFLKFRARNWMIVQDKKMISSMSDSKWIKLQIAMLNLDSPPAYFAKLITETKDYAFEQSFITQIPNYIGNWNAVYEEGMPFFFNIEYIIIRPLLRKFRGALIDDLIINQSNTIRRILRDLNIPFEEENLCFRVHGYRPL